jgi:lysophospholipase L1-like esterase
MVEHIRQRIQPTPDSLHHLNEVYTIDGVHLNDAGYQVWVEYVDEYVQPLAYDGDEAD